MPVSLVAAQKNTQKCLLVTATLTQADTFAQTIMIQPEQLGLTGFASFVHNPVEYSPGLEIQSRLKPNNQVVFFQYQSLFHRQSYSQGEQKRFQDQFVASFRRAHIHWRCCEAILIDICHNPLNTILLLDKLIHLRFLTHLDLQGNHLGSSGIHYLKTIQLQFIKQLNLTSTRLDHAAASCLATIPWKHMTQLALSSNSLGNKGLKALLQAEDWPQLQTLIIKDINLTPDGYKLLLRSDWVQLSRLVLGSCQVNSQVLSSLALHSFKPLSHCAFKALFKHGPGGHSLTDMVLMNGGALCLSERVMSEEQLVLGNSLMRPLDNKNKFYWQ